MKTLSENFIQVLIKLNESSLKRYMFPELMDSLFVGKNKYNYFY